MGFFKDRNCQTCGIKFNPTSTGQKYCNICSKINEDRIKKEWENRNKDKRREYNKKAYLKRKEKTKEAK